MSYNYKPSLKELRYSLKRRSKEYLLENTLHGVPYFVDSSRPKWERIIWFLLTMASLGSTIAIIMIIWDTFQTDPTITGIDTIVQKIEIDFPNIFLCYDLNQTSHTGIDKDKLYIYEQLYDWKWQNNIEILPGDESYLTKDDIRDTFALTKLNCAELLSNCSYRNIPESCNTLFINVLTPKGVCCKFNHSEPMRYTDISWDLAFATLTFPWRLYVINKGDANLYPQERSIIKGYRPTEIEFEVELTYVTSDIRHLTRRQRNCHYAHEGPGVNDCFMNCIADDLLKYCKCVPWSLAINGKKECPISKYSCLLTAPVNLAYCTCTLYCNHTAYSVKATTQGDAVSKVKLRNWPEGIYRRETRFGFLDLLVSFGGIASLFLGYSLLTTVELGYYFTLRAYCGAVVQSSRKKHNIVTVRVIEAKSPRKPNVISPPHFQYIE